MNRTLVGEVQALCTPTVLDQQTLELARSLELRSGAYHAPALPVELYQRSWRGDSNADHGLTRPALFPLSYTSTKFWRWRGELHSRMICFPPHRTKTAFGGDPGLLCRQMPCCLGYATSNFGAEYGNCTRASGLHPIARNIARVGDPGLAIRGTAPTRTPPG